MARADRDALERQLASRETAAQLIERADADMLKRDRR